MTYLKFIEDRIQRMVEDLSGAFGLEITIVDENLLHIAGTGRFLRHMQENSPKSSIFAQVLRSGKPAINIKSNVDSLCRVCANYESCEEVGNIAVPIQADGHTIGVISFAAFDHQQNELMEQKSESLSRMLTQMAGSIAKDVINIKMLNRINIGKANINELINSIDKGVIIVTGDGRVSHINSAALRALKINITGRSIVGRPVEEVASGIHFADSQGKTVYGEWVVDGTPRHISYRCQSVILNSEKVSTLISFDEQTRVARVAAQFSERSPEGFDCVIGECEALKKVIEQAKIAAQTDSTVLLYGESGTGKDLFVKAIHAASRRAGMPLVSVNCSAIPEALMESELFGYERGAFTGADPKGKPGKFELANGGIFFLDEIGDLPLPLQPKLLRVLQEREITRLSASQSVHLDIKVICATHKDLYELVRQKKFREDLFYRLNVIPLPLPPLRERGNDILLCARYITGRICERLEIPPKTLSMEVEKLFFAYSWPGNLREMENVLEYAVNFTKSNEICMDNLPAHILSGGPGNETIEELKQGILEAARQKRLTLQEMTEKFEKEVIGNYINIYGDTTEGKKRTAQALHVSLTTLYRKL